MSANNPARQFRGRTGGVNPGAPLGERSRHPSIGGLGGPRRLAPVTPTLNELLHAASRTFAVGIDLLPEPLRAEIEVAYLLLRVSDYLEDNESMEAPRKAALLEGWARVLEGGGLGPFEA